MAMVCGGPVLACLRVQWPRDKPCGPIPSSASQYGPLAYHSRVITYMYAKNADIEHVSHCLDLCNTVIGMHSLSIGIQQNAFKYKNVYHNKCKQVQILTVIG